MANHDSLAQQAKFQEQLFRQFEQRKQYQLALNRVFRITRNEGNVFTSFSYTQDQLNMRRKAEILQYSGASTQGGKRESKFKEWSRINKRFSNFSNYTAYLDMSCASMSETRPTSTTESGIPGPPQMLVYDSNVPLYNLKGMRPDMRQISIPAPVVPPFYIYTFPSNVSAATYKSGSFTVWDVSFVPLNGASVTYFNTVKPSSLTCTFEFHLDMITSFVLLDPTLSAYSKRVSVKKMELKILNLQSLIYLMTDPQKYTSDYILHTNSLDISDNRIFEITQNEYGNHQTDTIRLLENKKIVFPVAARENLANIIQETDRITMNILFEFHAFDFKGVRINPSLPINMDGLTVQFTLTPLNVLLK